MLPPTEIPAVWGSGRRPVTVPPIVSMIDWKVSCMWRTWLISASLHWKWKRKTGIPHASTLRVDVAPAFLVGDHLAAPREPDRRAVLFADLVLERLAVALVARAGAAERTEHRHVEPAADFDVVPAREILLLILQQPPRH